DMLSSQVPLILRKEIYASACIAGGALLYAGDAAGFNPTLTALSAATLVILLRLLAIRHNWSLPRAGRAENSTPDKRIE
ncbi:MAG: trimeric intracellular cation channel family protein, partial [Desulfuromonadaceae bacterium]